jgi:hypothetical protein
MNCAVCGCRLYAARAVFQCSCEVITHAQCFEKHIVESHKPPFTTGAFTLQGEFVPRSAEAEQGSHPTEKEPIALGTVKRAK